MSLFLLGMRGAGKSSAGALAADRIGAPFFDADLLIQDRVGKSIAEIFAERGEAAFRSLEKQVLRELLPEPGQLVATGGGCVLDAEIRAALHRFGHCIWLSAPATVLAKRIRGSDRPSLTGADPTQELGLVLAQREPLYRVCADQIVDSGTRTIEEVASVIEQLWSLLPHHQLR